MRHTHFFFSSSRIIFFQDRIGDKLRQEIDTFGFPDIATFPDQEKLTFAFFENDSIDNFPEGEWKVFQKAFQCALGFDIDNQIGEVKESALSTLLLNVFPHGIAIRILETIYCDVAHFRNWDPASKNLYNFEQILSLRRGMQAIAAHRILHELWARFKDKKSKSALYQIELLAKFVQKETNVEIHPGAVMGPGCALDHGTGTVIGATAIIAPNVVFYHGITLGATGVVTKNGRRHPVIGSEFLHPQSDRIINSNENNVEIANGVQVLGPCVVEDGCRLGADSKIINSYIGANVKIAPNVTIQGVIVPPDITIIASTPHDGKYYVLQRDVQDPTNKRVVIRKFPKFDPSSYHDYAEESTKKIFGAFKASVVDGKVYDRKFTDLFSLSTYWNRKHLRNQVKELELLSGGGI